MGKRDRNPKHRKRNPRKSPELTAAHLNRLAASLVRRGLASPLIRMRGITTTQGEHQ